MLKYEIRQDISTVTVHFRDEKSIVAMIMCFRLDGEIRTITFRPIDAKELDEIDRIAMLSFGKSIFPLY